MGTASAGVILIWVAASSLGVVALWLVVSSKTPAAWRAAPSRWWLVAGLAVGLVTGPLPALAGEVYVGVSIDAQGQLHIVTADQRDITPARAPHQVGFDQPAISADGTTVGWLALYPNCCTSYPIPLALVIYRDGKVRHTFGERFPVWKWRFEANGKHVAFAQETVHGHLGVHFELRDVESGRLIAAHDGDPLPDAPQWIRNVAD